MAASQKAGKKRTAPAQTGPKAKKVHLESTKSDKKRSRPITQAITQDNGSDSDQSDVEEVENDGDEFVDEFEAAEEDEQAMQVDSAPEQQPKDPNGVYCTLFCEKYNNLISMTISCSRVT
jgi:pumilio family protein 6